LASASIPKADLRDAGLFGADLSGATLSDGKLDGADLSHTDLTHTRLDGQQQLEKACGTDAKLPLDLTLRPCPAK